MFALRPWTNRRTLLPRVERPFGLMPDEFSTLFNRLFHHMPVEETPEWPYGWAMTMEEMDKELLVRVELPGFEPAEVNVEVMPERLRSRQNTRSWLRRTRRDRTGVCPCSGS